MFIDIGFGFFFFSVPTNWKEIPLYPRIPISAPL